MSRKREWIERRHSITEETDSSMSPDPDETNRSEGGEVIESEMKRLRVAYNYDGTLRLFDTILAINWHQMKLTGPK